jgi:preprotein translocase subunit SecF
MKNKYLWVAGVVIIVISVGITLLVDRGIYKGFSWCIKKNGVTSEDINRVLEQREKSGEDLDNALEEVLKEYENAILPKETLSAEKTNNSEVSTSSSESASKILDSVQEDLLNAE